MLYSGMKKQGFTLIEMLIYIAVLTLATSAAVVTLISLRTVLERNRVERQLTDAATSILERFVREVRGAKGVGISGGLLQLNQTPTTTSFYLSGSDVKVRTQVGGSVLSDYPLDPPSVVVSNLSFTEYTGTSTSSAVRVSFTLSVTGSRASTTKMFGTTAVARGSYE